VLHCSGKAVVAAISRRAWRSSEAGACAVAAWTLASSRKENGEATGRSGRGTAGSPNDATALVCADTLPNAVYRRKPVQELGSVTRWVGVLA
jgi:hypothetical protein